MNTVSGTHLSIETTYCSVAARSRLGDSLRAKKSNRSISAELSAPPSDNSLHLWTCHATNERTHTRKPPIACKIGSRAYRRNKRSAVLSLECAVIQGAPLFLGSAVGFKDKTKKVIKKLEIHQRVAGYLVSPNRV